MRSPLVVDPAPARRRGLSAYDQPQPPIPRLSAATTNTTAANALAIRSPDGNRS